MPTFSTSPSIDPSNQHLAGTEWRLKSAPFTVDPVAPARARPAAKPPISMDDVEEVLPPAPDPPRLDRPPAQTEHVQSPKGDDSTVARTLSVATMLTALRSLGHRWVQWNTWLWHLWFAVVMQAGLIILISAFVAGTLMFFGARQSWLLQLVGRVMLGCVTFACALSGVDELLHATPWWDRIVSPAAWLYTGGAAWYGWRSGRQIRRSPNSPRS